MSVTSTTVLDSNKSKSQEQYLYDRVAKLVLKMIEDGTLQPGEKIPSLRKMSKQLQISITTVMQAYLQLENEGIVEAKPQSGFYVCNKPLKQPSVPKRENPTLTPRRVRCDDQVKSIFSTIRDPNILPLGIADPSAELLPVKGLNRAMMNVASQKAVELIEYAPPNGCLELRRQIASRSVDIGCEVSPDDIIITNGATEALAIALRSVASSGDIIAVESPTYFSILQIIESLGMLALEICSCPEDGLCLDELEAALQKTPIKAVITVANFNNPTGSLMPQENKKRLVEMLSKKNIPLLEDDIHGDLHFSDKRPRIAKCYDKKGLVITYGSFSKSLAPGYRVGWISPGRFKESVMRTKFISSCANATFPQLTIAEFLRTGNYDRHLRRLRKAYSNQVDKMRRMIAQYFPKGTCATQPKGGFVLWIKLPNQINCNRFFEEALAIGISVAPGSIFSSTSKYKHYIRLSCGYPWSETVENAVIQLGEIAHALSKEALESKNKS